MQYLRAPSKYLGCGNPQNPMWQGGMSEQRSCMFYIGRLWATGILQGDPEVVHLQSWNVNHGLPSGMKWNFWETMRINFVVSQWYQNLKWENSMIFGMKLKHSTWERIPATNSGRNFWLEQYCKPMVISFQFNSKFCWLRWQPRSGHECIGDCPRP